MKVGTHINSRLFSYGKCALTGVLYKDVLFPSDPIQLRTYFDNSNCLVDVRKYTFRLLRRIQVFGDKNLEEKVGPDDKSKYKPLYFTDHIVHDEELKSNCKKN